MFGLARHLEAYAVALQGAQFPQQAAEVPQSVALGGLPGPALGFGGGLGRFDIQAENLCLIPVKGRIPDLPQIATPVSRSAVKRLYNNV